MKQTTFYVRVSEMRDIKQKIYGVLFDIDGCLNDIEIGAPLPLKELEHLQNYNSNSSKENNIPFLTLNTGRPLAYTEVFAQILGTNHFFIAEAGAILARIRHYAMDVIYHSKFNPLWIKKIENALDEFLMRYPKWKEHLQPTKLIIKTFLFAAHSSKIDLCWNDLNDFFKDKSKLSYITPSGREEIIPLLLDRGHNFINFSFQGITKGSILNEFFKNEEKILGTKLTGENFAAVGDSPGDWDFMKHCGFKACPSNASPELKKKCDFVSKHEGAKGAVEIIEAIVSYNSMLEEAK